MYKENYLWLYDGGWRKLYKHHQVLSSLAMHYWVGGNHTEDKMGVHVHAKKAYGGRRYIAPLIPSPGLRLSSQLHAPTPPRKEPRQPLNVTPWALHRLPGHFGEDDKRSIAPNRASNPRSYSDPLHYLRYCGWTKLTV